MSPIEVWNRKQEQTRREIDKRYFEIYRERINKALIALVERNNFKKLGVEF